MPTTHITFLSIYSHKKHSVFSMWVKETIVNLRNITLIAIFAWIQSLSAVAPNFVVSAWLIIARYPHHAKPVLIGHPSRRTPVIRRWRSLC